MTLDEFRDTLNASSPPAGLSPELRALWEDARGNWEGAHAVAQEIDGRSGAWIHAYLHRKEGDLSNAGYWYRRAGQPVAHDALDAEWRRLVEAMFAAGDRG